MAASASSMTNLARAAKIAALLLFFLPWVTVSCSTAAMSQLGGAGAPSMGPMGGMGGSTEVPIATATGAQLAMGSVSVANPSPSAAANPDNPFSKPDMAVLGAALLILLSLAGTFLLQGKTGATLAILGCALAAAAICYTVFIRIPKAVGDSFAHSSPGGGAPPMSTAELAQLIQVKAQIGFWLTLAALAAAIVLNFMVMKAGSVVSAPASTPADPPSA